MHECYKKLVLKIFIVKYYIVHIIISEILYFTKNILIKNYFVIISTQRNFIVIKPENYEKNYPNFGNL